MKNVTRSAGAAKSRPVTALVLAAAMALPAASYADPPPWVPAWSHRDRDDYHHHWRDRHDRDRVVYVQSFYAPPPRYYAPPPVYVPVQPAPVYGTACGGNVLGGMIGGAAGGYLGSQIGRGDGRLAATAAGAVLGLVVGQRAGQGGC